MSRKTIFSILLAMLAASALYAVVPTGGDYVLLASTIDSGGGTSAGGDFILHGTAGQPEAHMGGAVGGDFILMGGFWAEIDDITELIFKDGFEDSLPES